MRALPGACLCCQDTAALPCTAGAAPRLPPPSPGTSRQLQVHQKVMQSEVALFRIPDPGDALLVASLRRLAAAPGERVQVAVPPSAAWDALLPLCHDGWLGGGTADGMLAAAGIDLHCQPQALPTQALRCGASVLRCRAHAPARLLDAVEAELLLRTAAGVLLPGGGNRGLAAVRPPGTASNAGQLRGRWAGWVLATAGAGMSVAAELLGAARSEPLEGPPEAAEMQAGGRGATTARITLEVLLREGGVVCTEGEHAAVRAFRWGSFEAAESIRQGWGLAPTGKAEGGRPTERQAATLDPFLLCHRMAARCSCRAAPPRCSRWSGRGAAGSAGCVAGTTASGCRTAACSAWDRRDLPSPACACPLPVDWTEAQARRHPARGDGRRRRARPCASTLPTQLAVRQS